MKAMLGFISFALLAAGLTGLLRQGIDWMPTIFGFVRFIIPEGYEAVGYTVLILLGLAAAVLTNTVARRPAAD